MQHNFFFGFQDLSLKYCFKKCTLLNDLYIYIFWLPPPKKNITTEIFLDPFPLKIKILDPKKNNKEKCIGATIRTR